MQNNNDIEQAQALISEIANATFKKAQELVPDKSGSLKKSGTLKIDATGFTITYTANHASTIHEGQTDSTAGQYIMRVPRHTRQLDKGSTVVKAHTKTFKPGYKPEMRPDGSWYTSTTSNTTRPTPWVQDAWIAVRGSLGSRLAIYLPKRLIIEEL